MIAVDTNVVIRLLTGDDPNQAALAKALFQRGPIWIATTVLLETGWVLKSLYGFQEEAIRQALSKLLGLANVHVEDKIEIAKALALNATGVGLADALHLSNRPANSKFATFDRPFARKAIRSGIADILILR